MSETKVSETKVSETKVPERFRSCFWDSDFDDLDIEKNKDFIITRLYVKGGLSGIDWVHLHYSDSEIEEAAKKRRALNPIVANYLRKKYNLAKEDMAYYRMSSMGGTDLWNY
ncbi:MAG: hypothetical protein LUG99_13690 [Lachnospiraceae bacterium]|nr:hypothetical protein [Lachnospiraceae bacterium]